MVVGMQYAFLVLIFAYEMVQTHSSCQSLECLFNNHQKDFLEFWRHLASDVSPS